MWQSWQPDSPAESLPPCRRVEVDRLDEPAGVGGAVLAVHAGVVPVHGQRTVVADLVECSHDRGPVDAAVAGRAELPAGPRIAAGPVPGQYAGPAVERQLGVLH